jgi:hypothetical protein
MTQAWERSMIWSDAIEQAQAIRRREVSSVDLVTCTGRMEGEAEECSARRLVIRSQDRGVRT